MLQKYKTYLWALFVAILTTIPVKAIAQGGIDNPLGDTNLQGLFVAIIEAVRDLGFLVAVLALIYAGFMFVTARGNEEKLRTAKTAFLWSVIGTGVLLGAWVLAEVLQGTVEQF